MDIHGYELPRNLQNFMQKDLTKVKIVQKVFFVGGATFSETPCTIIQLLLTAISWRSILLLKAANTSHVRIAQKVHL